jgi:hypothetical protein
MKTLSLLAAAAVASSLAVSAASSPAAPFKANPGPHSAQPVKPAAIVYLRCDALLNVSGVGGGATSVRIWNTSGTTLKAGTLIHIGYTHKGQQKKVSLALKSDVPKGGAAQMTIGPYDFLPGCTAQANLLANPGPSLKVPPPQTKPGRPGPGPR